MEEEKEEEEEEEQCLSQSDTEEKEKMVFARRSFSAPAPFSQISLRIVGRAEREEGVKGPSFVSVRLADAMSQKDLFK